MSETAAFPTIVTNKLYQVEARLITYLTNDITAGQTNFAADTTGFPAIGFVTIENETIYYPSLSALQFGGVCTRGYAGSAVSHLAGKAIKLSVAAATTNRLIAEVIAIQTALKANLTSTVLTSPVFTGTINGWTTVTDTWSYNAANKINVPSGAALIYQKGDKLRIDQGVGYYYMYVIAVADTVLTTDGGTAFPVQNLAFISKYYSHQENPLGFPHWFAVTAPVWNVSTYDNGSGLQPATSECRFKISGNQYTAHYKGSGVKAGASSQIDMTSHSFIVPINTTSHTGIGIVLAYTSVFIFGTMNDLFSCLFTTSIADNATMSHLSFTITYEI